jgi:uncharacterized protein
MAIRLSPRDVRPEDGPRSGGPGDGRRPARVRDVFVTMLVCLALWAFLFAPVLERNAETGPLGARRTIALAVLRPITAVSDAIGVSAVSDRALRALGDDPDAQPGGEIDLPDDLPSLPPIGPAPSGATGDDDGHPGKQGDGDGSVAPLPPVRKPTPQNKLRVAVVGDSLSQGLGPSVERWFNANVARVLSLGRQSTGLAREDYFNWPRAMREIETAFRPDIVFIMLGTNDNQAQISHDGAAVPVGSTAWVNGYRGRVASFVHEATSAGTRVVWVGVPVVKDRRRWEFYRRIDSIYEDVTADDPLATFVDTWDAFEGRDGGYTAFLRNDHGVVQEMRAGDGVHFTPTGYDFLARLAIEGADDAFDLPQNAVGFHL